jgi:pimeloyl-ACP methyl ester carboxylesterase
MVATPGAPLWGELRYGGELARLLASELTGRARTRSRPASGGRPAPVLLIPGFMAGDSSLAMMRYWLERRGHAVMRSGLRANVGCAERTVARLQRRLADFAGRSGTPIVVVGQSRGGALARALAVREPERIGALITLGSPVCAPLAVSSHVLRTVRWVAWLGDRGVPGVLSMTCHEGPCCADFRADLVAPLPDSLRAVAVHSRSDAIVDWRACLDPYARAVEIESSHCGMSVHPRVYRLLADVLDGGDGARWNG